MSIALLLLALLPLAVLPLIESNDDEAGAPDMAQDTDIQEDLGSILQPLITDDLSPGGQVPDPEDVLAPLEDQPDEINDPDYAGSGLQPLDEDDTLAQNNGDQSVVYELTETEATPTERIDHANAKMIEGFDPYRDILEIEVQADSDIFVEPSAQGDNGEVWINGALFAVLLGAPEASLENLEIAFR